MTEFEPRTSGIGSDRSTYQLSHNCPQCAQFGQLLQILSDKFAYKSNP